MEQAPVVILLPYLSCSGLELFGIRFAADLIARGHRAMIAAPDGSLIAQQCDDRGIARIEFPEVIKYEPHSIPACIKLLKNFNPAVLIAFRTQLMYPVHIARLFTGLHTPLFLFYRIGAGRFFRKDPFHRRLFKYLCAVVPNAKHVENRIYKYWGIDPEKVLCIHSGVNTEKYRPDPERKKQFRKLAGFSEQDFVIGCTGRIHPEKGSEILLRSLFDDQGVAKKHSRVKLVYVGREYEPGYNDYLKTVARNLEVEDRFKILPFRNDVEMVYPGFDLFAFAVTSSETYAYVALEAMASGVAPVVPYVGGMKEMFEDKTEGWFFEHRNQNSLRKVLAQILDMPDNDFKKVGTNARKRICMHADWNKMMEKYLQLFKSCRIKGFENYNFTGR